MERKTQTKGTSQDELFGLPDREQSRGHYTTPPDFFSQLNERILTNLPEEEAEAPAPVSWWVKARPVVYLAACFVGLMLCFRVVQDLQPQASTPSQEQSADLEASLDEEDWALYYSDYASREDAYEQEFSYALGETL